MMKESFDVKSIPDRIAACVERIIESTPHDDVLKNGHLVPQYPPLMANSLRELKNLILEVAQSFQNDEEKVFHENLLPMMQVVDLIDKVFLDDAKWFSLDNQVINKNLKDLNEHIADLRLYMKTFQDEFIDEEHAKAVQDQLKMMAFTIYNTFHTFKI